MKRERKFAQITPTLKRLYWLPVGERIADNILLTDIQSSEWTGAKGYVTDLRYVSIRQLRSSSDNCLES